MQHFLAAMSYVGAISGAVSVRVAAEAIIGGGARRCSFAAVSVRHCTTAGDDNWRGWKRMSRAALKQVDQKFKEQYANPLVGGQQ